MRKKNKEWLKLTNIVATESMHVALKVYAAKKKITLQRLCQDIINYAFLMQKEIFLAKTFNKCLNDVSHYIDTKTITTIELSESVSDYIYDIHKHYLETHEVKINKSRIITAIILNYIENESA